MHTSRVPVPPIRAGRLVRGHAFGLLATAAAFAHAQSDAVAGPGASRGFSVSPTLSVSMTLTDNVRLSETDREVDLITQISPGISVSSSSGRIRGFLNYSLNAVVYANRSSSSEIQHALSTAATIEAVDDRVFIDLAGGVSQQAVSVFGTQSSNNTQINSNRTAVATYSVSPYVRGRLGNLANYDARLTYTGSSNGSSAVSNGASSQAVVRLNGATALRAVGWSLTASRQSFEYDATGTSHSDRLQGVLSYAVSPELQVFATGGRESEDIQQGGETRSSNTSGWGFNWVPSERTRVSVNREKRFFGTSHAYNVEYRTPRTAWRYADSRDLTTGFAQLRLGSQGTAYDLFFAQFASIEPDPVARAALVDAFLRNNGIPPNTVVLSGSLANATLVQRRQELSFAWSGLRDTLTVSVSQAEGERADRVVVVVDDFSGGNLVRQRGVSIGVAHRLTPQSSINLTATQQSSSGTVDTRTSRLRALSLGWSGKLGARTSSALGLRHTRASGSVGSYTETALTATMILQF